MQMMAIGGKKFIPVLHVCWDRDLTVKSAKNGVNISFSHEPVTVLSGAEFPQKYSWRSCRSYFWRSNVGPNKKTRTYFFHQPSSFASQSLRNGFFFKFLQTQIVGSSEYRAMDG